MTPADRTTRSAAFALPGFAAFVGLHALFVVGWEFLFARPPWPGYEESARMGMIEPWFVNSPRALWLTRIVLFGLALGIVLPVRTRRLARTAAFWAGAAIAVAVAWATTTSSSLEGGTGGYFFYPLRIGFPIVAGAVTAVLIQRLRRTRRHEGAAAP